MPDPEMRTLDLHTHTTASDGDQSPTQLITRAHTVGLTVLAVTDHDTTDGVAEAMEAGNRLGVEVVPGIELSAQIDYGQCHILGLGIDPHHAGLLERLRDIQYKRVNRNALIIGKLRALGIDITLTEVEQMAGGDIVARPHFAKVLIAKGVVSSVQEAFDKLLAEGKPGNAPKEKVTQIEAIELIHAAGGVAILAHPNNLKRSTPEETEQFILALQAQGLDGIEARYNLHTPEENTRYLALADRHSLLTSGGSDFHGPTVKPKVMLGDVENGKAGPYSLLQAIRARCA